MIIHFRLYRERVTQIEKKLAEVKAGRAPEYLQPLEELQVNMKNRMEVSSIMRELRLSNITCKFDAEQLATEQNFEVRSIVQCGSLQCILTFLPAGGHQFNANIFALIFSTKLFTFNCVEIALFITERKEIIA